MSEMVRDDGVVPTWDLGDRLAKALRVAGLTNSEMAEYLGVSRNTVSNYINAHTRIDRRTRMLWAMRTGVPLEWLETGQTPAGQQPDGGSQQSECAIRDSNPEPAESCILPGQRVA